MIVFEEVYRLSQIIDIKQILKTPDVLAVLSESVGMPTEEKLKKRAQFYINNNNVVAFGYISDGVVLGLIVLDISNKEEIVILDIAVSIDNQHIGIGRKLIKHVLAYLNPIMIIAETDDDAVDFYRKFGFIIKNLSEKYPNIIRYECKYFNKTNE